MLIMIFFIVEYPNKKMNGMYWLTKQLDQSQDSVKNTDIVPKQINIDFTKNQCFRFEYGSTTGTVNVMFNAIGDKIQDTILTLKHDFGTNETIRFCMRDLMAFGSGQGVLVFETDKNVTINVTEHTEFKPKKFLHSTKFNVEERIDIDYDWKNEWKTLSSKGRLFEFVDDKIHFQGKTIQRK